MPPALATSADPDAPAASATLEEPGTAVTAGVAAGDTPAAGSMAGEATVIAGALEEAVRRSAEATPATPAVQPAGGGASHLEEALAIARRLAPALVSPVACAAAPLNSPDVMPNAPRAYRTGIHQGIDYPCGRGHSVVASLDGRVVVAAGDYRTPTPAHRNALLAVPAQRNSAPPFTLIALYGNYVVVDHGLINGVGHVITIYAHLETVGPEIRVGTPVRAGAPLGTIGNTGLPHNAAGDPDGGAHLHWEIHIDDRYLAAGLSSADTRAVYTALFENPENPENPENTQPPGATIDPQPPSLAQASVRTSAGQVRERQAAAVEVLRNDELVLTPVATIVGDLAPKSIVASGTGLYFAQNVMYKHTISVFDDTKQLVKSIDDTVDLRGFGYDVTADAYRGAPVEAAFTADGSFAFVSNYRMYGPGDDPHASNDDCEKDEGQDSFVYRIDTASLEIDRVYPVGVAPKFLAVTPDDRFLVVSNWCGFDVTVVDLTTHTTVGEIDVGRYPRGIAVTSDSRTAYVAVMGSTDIAVIDLPAPAGDNPNSTPAGARLASYLTGIGNAPRHLVLSPDDRLLYVTLNGEDAVVAVDVATGEVTQRAETGHQPRSMDISDDGTALYVVNYRSDTMTKLRTRDFAVLQQFPTAPLPIGITYDTLSGEVWVSAYSGVIHVFAETEPDPPGGDR